MHETGVTGARRYYTSFNKNSLIQMPDYKEVLDAISKHLRGAMCSINKDVALMDMRIIVDETSRNHFTIIHIDDLPNVGCVVSYAIMPLSGSAGQKPVLKSEVCLGYDRVGIVISSISDYMKIR